MHSVWAHCEREPALYAALCAFVAGGIWGKENDFGPGAAMGVADATGPRGAVVFHGYQPDEGVIEMSAAGDHWLSRSVLRDLFGYVFDTLGCQAAVMRVDPENTRMCRIASAFGFKRYDIPRLRGRDRAEAVFVLGDDDWRASRFNRKA